MRNLIIILAVIVSFSSACKTKQKTEIQQSSQTGISENAKTQGKVSHQYRDSGCATVIVVKLSDQAAPLVLIPKDALPSEYDKDGTDIYFNYRMLRMPNPKGCTTGIPAELTDISIKK